ncbi:MAG: dimethylarginine dimethylaminohydrolase family protein [Thermoplasmatota archaeon]
MKFLLCPPTHFRIASVDNPFMAGQTIDPERAIAQWMALRDAYASIGDVILAEPQPDFPDQVFTANPIIAGPPGSNVVVPANMRYPQRRGETERLLAALPGYDVRVPDTDAVFEGGGDLLWTPSGDLIAGHGPRTDLAAIEPVAACFGVKPLTVRLVTSEYYHLDTCLCILDDERALWVPDAFDDASQQALGERFTLFDVSNEGMDFAGNAHCPDGKHVLIDANCTKTMDLLRSEGFAPVPLDTSEFRKSGGSVYCMKHVV